MGEDDLVSVIVPIYNKEHSVQKAIDSLRAQSYTGLCILLCDNASEDGSGAICSAYQRVDSRITYIRRPRNMGATYNFMEPVARTKGKFLMWLAADDWLESSEYVARCVSELEAAPGSALVAGIAKYMTDGAFSHMGRPINCSEASGRERVVSYYRQVEDNALFYGVHRRQTLIRAVRTLTHHNRLGDDWCLLAAVAFLGTLRTLDDVSICRDWAWNEGSFERLVHSMGWSRWQAKSPYAVISWHAALDILFRSPVFHSVSPVQRMALAARVLETFAHRHPPRSCFTARRVLARGARSLRRKCEPLA
jgi:glycosyltransferase involved in cell wall biosynthesis